MNPIQCNMASIFITNTFFLIWLFHTISRSSQRFINFLPTNHDIIQTFFFPIRVTWLAHLSRHVFIILITSVESYNLWSSSCSLLYSPVMFKEFMHLEKNRRQKQLEYKCKTKFRLLCSIGTETDCEVNIVRFVLIF